VLRILAEYGERSGRTGETQAIMRIVEVLPAPFGPRKPNASPWATSKSIASTATRSPKRFPRARAEISGLVELSMSARID
jgi:hypothetical protein